MHRPLETVARDHWRNRMSEGVAVLARIQRGWNERVYGVRLEYWNVSSPGPDIDIDVSVDDESGKDRGHSHPKRISFQLTLTRTAAMFSCHDFPDWSTSLLGPLHCFSYSCNVYARLKSPVSARRSKTRFTSHWTTGKMWIKSPPWIWWGSIAWGHFIRDRTSTMRSVSALRKECRRIRPTEGKRDWACLQFLTELSALLIENIDIHREIASLDTPGQSADDLEVRWMFGYGRARERERESKEWLLYRTRISLWSARESSQRPITVPLSDHISPSVRDLRGHRTADRKTETIGFTRTLRVDGLWRETESVSYLSQFTFFIQGTHFLLYNHWLHFLFDRRRWRHVFCCLRFPVRFFPSSDLKLWTIHYPLINGRETTNLYLTFFSLSLVSAIYVCLLWHDRLAIHSFSLSMYMCLLPSSLLSFCVRARWAR